MIDHSTTEVVQVPQQHGKARRGAWAELLQRIQGLPPGRAMRVPSTKPRHDACNAHVMARRYGVKIHVRTAPDSLIIWQRVEQQETSNAAA